MDDRVAAGLGNERYRVPADVVTHGERESPKAAVRRTLQVIMPSGGLTAISRGSVLPIQWWSWQEGLLELTERKELKTAVVIRRFSLGIHRPKHEVLRKSS